MELQKAIAKLPQRSARKQGKVDAVLPRTGPASAPPDEEEEEDE